MPQTDLLETLPALRFADEHLLDSIPHMVWVAGSDGAAVYHNRQMLEYTGLNPGDALGSRWVRMIHPADRAAAAAAWADSLRTGDPYECEHPMLRRDGVYRWHLARAEAERGADGAVVRWVGTCTDIDDLKRTEVAVREGEGRYRELFDANPHPMWVYDTETLRFLAVNDMAVARYGYSRDEFLAMSVTDIRPPEDVPALLADIRTSADQLMSRGLWRHRWKDGSVRVVDVSAHALVFGDRPARLILALDVTDQMRADAEAVAARETKDRALARWQAVVGSMADGLVIADGAGNLIDWNPAALRMHGFETVEEVRRHLATFPETFVLCRPDGEPMPLAEWPMARVLRGETITDVEITLRRLDAGLELTVSYSGAPVRGADGVVEFAMLTIHDVTARRRAEAEVRRTAALLQAVADGTTDAVFVKDLAGRYLFSNDAGARFVGRLVAEVIGTDDTALFEPESARGIIDQDHRVMASGQAETMEKKLTAAGVTRIYQATKAPYRDSVGNVIGIVGVARDVTLKRQLAAERDSLLARLQLHIERLPLGYLLTDGDMRYTHWNPAAEKMFGFTQAEVLGRHPFDLIVPPESQVRVGKIFDRIKAGDMSAHGASENVTKDGRTIACEWYNTPLFAADGTFLGLLSLAQDVTTRRQGEEALRLRDRAIQAVTQGILITDSGQPDDPIIYASPGFTRMTGYPADEALGRNCRFLQGKDTDPAAVARLQVAVRDGEACQVELLNYRKNGTPFWNDLTVSPVRDADGRLTHFVGVMSDVTARRLLEEQFRQSQKMEAVGQLAGGVAHDFNNLLTIITGYTELLLDSAAPGDPSRDLLAEIQKAGERSAGLTRQLLTFSRKEALAPKIIDMNAVVRETDRMLRRVIGEDVRLVLDLDPALGAVRADQGQFEQVLLNLAVNARDAMPKGGRLTVSTRNVGPGAGPLTGPAVVVSVTDTGTGMTDEVRRRIFEPFFTTKGVGKGTGLGLAVVHGVVTQSGGQVVVESAPGRGTTFHIHLPRTAQPVRPDGSKHDVPEPRRGSETVLLVEDEEVVRSLTRHILQMNGYTVLEAEDAVAAVRVMAGHTGRIDLLITDVVLPGGGGPELAARLASARPGLRVLYLSGYTADAVAEHGVESGRAHFLQKPYSPAGLAVKVRDVLDAPAAA